MAQRWPVCNGAIRLIKVFIGQFMNAYASFQNQQDLTNI